MFKNNLRTEMAIIFISMSLITIIFFSITTNFMFIKNFGNYISQSTSMEFKNIASSLAYEYKVKGNLNEASYVIAHSAMMKGYGIKVKDLSGKTIVDINHMMKMMSIRNKKSTTKTFPIDVNGKKVGSVYITYFGSMPMNESDINFLYKINKYNIVITVLIILLAFLISIYVSKYLAKPIMDITDVAKNLENGKLDKRIMYVPKEKELFNLVAAINHLGESLKNQDKIREQMVHDIAHELRTPLTTLESHLEAMIDGIWYPSKKRLTSLSEEVKRLSKLVNDLELLNKAEADTLSIKKEYFNLSFILENIILNYESMFYNKNQTIEKNIKNDIFLYGDKERISEVIINLLTNANKYTQSGGNIFIKLYNDDKNIVLIVKDNGQGIAKEDIPFIFERFYRTEKSRSRDTGGSGIGLSIVKAVVKAHGGTIVVDSVLNKGTKFTVILPI